MLPFPCVGDAIALLCGGGHGQVAVGTSVQAFLYRDGAVDPDGFSS